MPASDDPASAAGSDRPIPPGPPPPRATVPAQPVNPPVATANPLAAGNGPPASRPGSQISGWQLAVLAVVGVFSAIGIGTTIFAATESRDASTTSIMALPAPTATSVAAPSPEQVPDVSTLGAAATPTVAQQPTVAPAPPVPQSQPTPVATRTASDLLAPRRGEVVALARPNPALDPPRFRAVGVNQISFGAPLVDVVAELGEYFGEPSFISADLRLISWGGTGEVYAVRVAATEDGRFDAYEVNLAAIAAQNWGTIGIGETLTGSVPFWLDRDITDDRFVYVDDIAIDGLAVRCSFRSPCLHQEVVRNAKGTISEFRRLIGFSANSSVATDYVFGDSYTSTEGGALPVYSAPFLDSPPLAPFDFSNGATVATLGPPVDQSDGRRWVRVVTTRDHRARAGWMPLDELRVAKPRDESGELPRVDRPRPDIEALIGMFHGQPYDDYDYLAALGVSSSDDLLGQGIIACCDDVLIETAVMNPTGTGVDILLSRDTESAAERFEVFAAWSLLLAPDQMVFNNFYDDYYALRDVYCASSWFDEELFVVYDTSFRVIAAWVLTADGPVAEPNIAEISCGPS